MAVRACSRKLMVSAFVLSTLVLAGQALAQTIQGQVLGAGAPIAQSTVTLWQASSVAPKQLAQTKSDNNGHFTIHGIAAPDSTLYLVAHGGVPAANKAAGDNPAIALIAALGNKPPAKVTINEFTTIASVVTHAQLIVGDWIKGPPLALRIAAGNVPNFVDLATGGYGPAILGPLNSSQSPTMANFATLSSLLAGCITQVKTDACSRFFAATNPPNGGPPTDTLLAIESVAFNPWHQPDKIFALLDYFYPQPKFSPGKLLRPTPFLPYLNFVPSAWIFPLRFDGGGLSAPGKLMFDSEGNVWLANNFIVGAQNQDASWMGTLTKFAPNGRPLSPTPLGFTGGGLAGPASD